MCASFTDSQFRILFYSKTTCFRVVWLNFQFEHHFRVAWIGQWRRIQRALLEDKVKELGTNFLNF